MNKKIKIDIVSDVVCPWCTVGYKRLEKAIKELGIEENIEIEWQPFELNPTMSSEGQNLNEHLIQKYGSTQEQLNASKQNLVEAGADLGFTFDYFDNMLIVNTYEAHILLEYAKKYGKQTELKMRLTTAFFSERKNISKKDVLKQALLDVGLNAEEGIAMLNNDNAKQYIRKQQQIWKDAGVNSVPTVVFNRKTGVTGAQPVATFKQILSDLIVEE